MHTALLYTLHGERAPPRSAPGRAEHGTPSQVDALHGLPGEDDGLGQVLLGEALRAWVGVWGVRGAGGGGRGGRGWGWGAVWWRAGRVGRRAGDEEQGRRGAKGPASRLLCACCCDPPPAPHAQTHPAVHTYTSISMHAGCHSKRITGAHVPACTGACQQPASPPTPAPAPLPLHNHTTHRVPPCLCPTHLEAVAYAQDLAVGHAVVSQPVHHTLRVCGREGSGWGWGSQGQQGWTKARPRVQRRGKGNQVAKQPVLCSRWKCPFQRTTGVLLATRHPAPAPVAATTSWMPNHNPPHPAPPAPPARTSSSPALPPTCTTSLMPGHRWPAVTTAALTWPRGEGRGAGTQSK